MSEIDKTQAFRVLETRLDAFIQAASEAVAGASQTGALDWSNYATTLEHIKVAIGNVSKGQASLKGFPSAVCLFSCFLAGIFN